MEAIFIPELVLQETSGQKILQMERLFGSQKSVVDHGSIVEGVVKQLGNVEGARIKDRYVRLLQLAESRVGKCGKSRGRKKMNQFALFARSFFYGFHAFGYNSLKQFKTEG